LLLATIGLLAFLWRLFLSTRYAGWEESDYGNLAMVRGVLDGGFRHYDMNHMPGYYALGAAALAVVGDAVVASRAVSMIGGVAAAMLAVLGTDRLAGRKAAWLAGALLIVQPEFALYASSSLREPVYAAFVVGCLVALGRERLLLAGALAGGAFLVRFDATLSLGPVLLLHAVGRPGRLRRVVLALAPFAATIGLWSLYCKVDHGTFAFWSHAVQVNVETGLGGGHEGWVERSANGLRVALALVGWLLPWRIGWAVWLGLLAALAVTPWGRHDPRRTWAFAALTLTGVWAGIGLVGQHEPEHNLYWKWMAPLVPVLVPMGASALRVTADAVARRAGRVAAVVFLVLVMGQAVASNLAETRRQVARSDAWYRPQLELAQWIEAEVPEDMPLVLDNIPACWIDRREHERPLTSWHDIPVEGGDEPAFGAWVAREGIGWILWFREDWTQAPRVAPFLSRGGSWAGGGVRLTEVDREDGYGWIFFRVDTTTTGP
jgi:4-amino-4-deoxy-L-arabinose transferase-like glycosyltransferase